MVVSILLVAAVSQSRVVPVVGWIPILRGEAPPIILNSLNKDRDKVWKAVNEMPGYWSGGKPPELIGKNDWIFWGTDRKKYYFQFSSNGMCELIDLELNVTDYRKIFFQHSPLGLIGFKETPVFIFPNPESSWYPAYQKNIKSRERNYDRQIAMLDIKKSGKVEDINEVPLYDLYTFYSYVKSSSNSTICLEVGVPGSLAFDYNNKFDPVTSRTILTIKPSSVFAKALSRGIVLRVAHMNNELRSSSSVGMSRVKVWPTKSGYNAPTKDLIAEWARSHNEYRKKGKF